MQAAMAEIVGKKPLCDHLGWGRPRLDRVLERDKHFPVVSRGDQSGGWKFSIPEVEAYLGDAAPAPEGIGSKPKVEPAPAGKPAAKGIDRAQLRDAVKPALPKKAEETAVQVVDALKGTSPGGREAKSSRRSAYHSGEASARQRKDDADASLKEDKLRELRGELVSKAEIRQALSTVFARLGHDLDGLPEKIVKALDLREDVAPGIRAMIDQVRTEMVRGAEPLLQEGSEQT